VSQLGEARSVADRLLRQLEQRLRQAEEALRTATDHHQGLNRKANATETAKRIAQNDMRKYQNAARTARHEISKTQENITALQPSDAATYHQMKEEKIATIRHLSEKYADMDQRFKDLGDANNPLVKRREELNAKVTEQSEHREQKEVGNRDVQLWTPNPLYRPN
jgi:chromosome segregation ATPase